MSILFSKLFQYISGSANVYSPCSLLNKLSFRLNFVKSLWSSIKLTATTIRSSLDQQHTLLLFCEVYSHYLTTRTDEEFISEKSFLHDVVVTLKPIISNLYWDEGERAIISF